MQKGKKSEASKTCILDSFDFISQSDKNKFLKKAESLKVNQEDLLEIAIKGLLDDWIPFKTETKTTLHLPKRESVESESNK